MKISELRTGQGNVEVEGTVTELGNTRVFNKYGRELKVADAVFTDDSGSIRLTLWNDDITRFREGDKIKIINGYVSEFQGEKQLTSGKFGRMEKIGGDAGENNADENLRDVPAGDNSKKASVSKRDVKKKNEEGLGEYSEDEREEPSDDKPAEEELF